MAIMYDIAIIGSGPAGMTAGIYAKRAGFKTIIFEKAFVGGQMNYAHSIENFPGFNGISGFDLAMNMKAQLDGVESKTADVVEIEFSDDIKILKTKTEEISAKTVIIATGAMSKRLGLQHEAKFVGRGVSYCATCDGAFYKDKAVVVVGGGNTALEDSLYLANFCKSVALVHRREEFRGDKSTLAKVKQNSKITIYTNKVVSDILGENAVETVELKDTVSGAIEKLATDGIFVAIGYTPKTAFLNGAITLNENGEILTDGNLLTNIKGVYAVGDVRQKILKQVVTACSDGAIAVDQITKTL
jgi:thioredoxin reductase (NADPH)